MGRALELHWWGSEEKLKKVTRAQASGMPPLSSSSWGGVSMAHFPGPAYLATCAFWGKGWLHVGSRADSIHKAPPPKPAVCCHCYSPWENFLQGLVWAQGSEGEARQVGLWNKEKTEQECLWVLVEENIMGRLRTWLVEGELSRIPSPGISARAEIWRHYILEEANGGLWGQICLVEEPLH